MNTLKDLEQIANELLRNTFTFKDDEGNRWHINPYTTLGYRFKFDNAKSRLGCCKYGKKLITMSRGLSEVNLDKINGKLTDTILHEIAHALCVEVYGRRNGRGHGANWVYIAKQIGCDGKRCYDGSKIDKPISKYTLTCPTCKLEVNKHRKSKSGIACGKCCKGVYNSTHKFIIKQNY
jgi:SprT protein